ncbi:hypothetical protein HK405_002330, partial [Cladochytrium tenue]
TTAKSGVNPADCLETVRHVQSSCPNLVVKGLMTIGSPDHDPETGPNPDFLVMQRCQAEVRERLGLDMELSMGMSDDYEHAVEQGATNVRLGSSLFGARERKPAAA